jgi:hypothetical protein
MTIEQTTHLSEEAMNDVLVGVESPATSAHLAVCPVCRARLNEFQANMRLFNQATLAWSETRSATMARPERKRIRWTEFAPGAWVTAAAILLLVAIPVWQHRTPATKYAAPTTMASTTSIAGNEAEDTETQITADNELMRSVDVALSSNDESPIAEYYLSERPHPRANVRPELRTQ